MLYVANLYPMYQQRAIGQDPKCGPLAAASSINGTATHRKKQIRCGLLRNCRSTSDGIAIETA